MIRRVKSRHAAEQDRPEVLQRRRLWFQIQLDLDSSRFVFIDETWTATNTTRSTGDTRKASLCEWVSSLASQNHDIHRRAPSVAKRCQRFGIDRSTAVGSRPMRSRSWSRRSALAMSSLGTIVAFSLTPRRLLPHAVSVDHNCNSVIISCGGNDET